jgi:hypothetical protein
MSNSEGFELRNIPLSISDYLKPGKANAVSARTLCDLLHIGMRDVSKMVERERRSGVPICATSSERPGYYLAKTKGEMLEYCDGLLRRAAEIFKTRSACLATAETLPEGVFTLEG